MYNLSSIQSSFFTNKRITFKNSLDSSDPILDSDLTGESLSKRYFNVGTHPLISLKVIENLLPQVSGYTISAYVAGATYSDYNSDFLLTNVVTSDGLTYISIADSNTGNTPADSDTKWKPTTLLSLIIKDKIRGAIENVINNIVEPNFIEDNTYLYRIGDTTNDLITGTNKWVGFRIFPKSSDHLIFLINQMALFFTESEAITFYLYNQNTQVSTFDLTTVGGRLTWQDITQLELDSKTGAWYLFYNQTDVTGQAVGDNSLFSNYFYEYANITPFECDPDTDLNTIDVDSFVYTKNYGMNLNFSISYEMTDFIKQHENMFAECYNLQFAYDLLEYYDSNPEVRSNLLQRNIDLENLKFELKSFDGDTIIRRLKAARRALKASFDKLSCKDTAFEKNVENNYSTGTL